MHNWRDFLRQLPITGAILALPASVPAARMHRLYGHFVPPLPTA